ncbi:BTB/POZ domain-containing protein 9-like [Clavelina lepadiformis]|uniref:BTB/POZ domain-containing protein 9-like n=1 Tax=Clavelina lepadiformis TaxID=159417 RepID=UPI0040437AFD
MSVALCGPVHDDEAVSNTTSDIDHCEELSENIGNLVLNNDYNDVTFVVEGKNFPAHRVILAARCPYFRALLFGGMREAHTEAVIPIEDSSSDAFEILLRYIYTGKMKLVNSKEADFIEVLGLANKYGFPALESALSLHLQSTLSVSNACLIYDVATLYSLTELLNFTAEFIDRNATHILNSENFALMSLTATRSILQRDSLCVPEKTIFKSVVAWCDANPVVSTASLDGFVEVKSHEALLDVVRLPLIPLPDLLNFVRPSGLVASDLLLDAIKSQSECCDGELRHRGVLCPDENIATPQHGAQVVQGEMCASLLDGDTRNYDMDHGFTRHHINDDADRKEKCIKVKLGQPSIINHIRMLLWDKDSRSYSYYIEVSMDDKEWVRVVDYSKHFCRSWQNLFFPKRVVRYIRVVGTHNSIANKIFHLVALEAMYKMEKVRQIGDIIIAECNVATIDKSACIIEGVSRDRNALINGDMNTYDWDSGYTCHQLGNGAIVVQLAQPYFLSSIRLLLWDIDDRSYSYHIEVSCDMENWTIVADKRNLDCQSWQTLEFDRIAATFIRIVGTANTANEVFHCVHFECPASTVPVLTGDEAVTKPSLSPTRHLSVDQPPPEEAIDNDSTF